MGSPSTLGQLWDTRLIKHPKVISNPLFSFPSVTCFFPASIPDRNGHLYFILIQRLKLVAGLLFLSVKLQGDITDVCLPTSSLFLPQMQTRWWELQQASGNQKFLALTIKPWKHALQFLDFLLNGENELQLIQASGVRLLLFAVKSYINWSRYLLPSEVKPLMEVKKKKKSHNATIISISVYFYSVFQIFICMHIFFI